VIRYCAIREQLLKMHALVSSDPDELKGDSGRDDL
jgi:hypothetical protein